MLKTMTKAMKKIRRLVIGILAVLSLAASSVAACTCSHHSTEPPEEKKSCHGGGHDESSRADLNRPRIGETCVCLPFATELLVKGESFKLKKHVAAARTAPPLFKPEELRTLDRVVDAGPESGFYELLFSNLNFSRGPPLT